MKTMFVKETDNKGITCIIEGIEKDNKVFSIKRFICEVQEQDTDQETQELADMLLDKLNNTTTSMAREDGEQDPLKWIDMKEELPKLKDKPYYILVRKPRDSNPDKYHYSTWQILIPGDIEIVKKYSHWRNIE